MTAYLFPMCAYTSTILLLLLLLLGGGARAARYQVVGPKDEPQVCGYTYRSIHVYVIWL